MVLKIFGHPISQPSRAVMIFARLANIEHEFVLVDLQKGEHKKPEFLVVNPSGLVPAISDGEFNLSESHAILTYLHTTRHAEDHWYPADPQKRALVDRYLHWHHSNLRRAVYVVFAAVFAPMMNVPVSEATVNEAIATRTKSLTQIEAWLTANTYLAGSEPTIADLSALCEISTYRLIDFDLTPFPHIKAWVDRLFEIPAVAEGHQALNGFKANVSSLYHKASTADELWFDLCERHSIDPQTCSASNPIAIFQSSVVRISYLFLFFPRHTIRLNCRGEAWSVKEADGKLAGWNRACVVVEDSVLVSGGGSPNTNQAWMYAQQTGNVSEISAMNWVRAGHGLTYHCNRVFAFGGANASRASEKYYAGVWTPMSQMHFSHSWFTPATHGLNVYLCGGSSNGCEVFSTTAERFTAMDVSLPEISEACACWHGDKLVVIQRKSTTQIERGVITRTVDRESWGSSWANMSPVVVEGYAYIPRLSDKCVRRFSLADLKEVHVIKAPIDTDSS